MGRVFVELGTLGRVAVGGEGSALSGVAHNLLGSMSEEAKE
jgi:hypothetical protein